MKVSFCGISGSSMSALAQVLLAKGFEVCGSDRSFDQGKDEQNRRALEDAGVKIFPQDGSAIDEATRCLYISTAVEDTIPDVKKALELNVPIKKRSDLLAEIFNAHPYSVAVGGTSGKTTVTAMIGYILDQAGKKPMVINGGLLLNYIDRKGIPNVILNDGDLCVAEADESDGSIEKYRPYIAVINNITIDHKPIDELKKLFNDFASKARGGIVANLDCINSAEIVAGYPNVITFSKTNPKADVYVSEIEPIAEGCRYKLNGKFHTLRLCGAFNVCNAAAAIAACSVLGIKMDLSAGILESFLGTKRRLEVIGRKNGITVIDDFAHNPDKVLASMSALRDYNGRLLVMFQPHGFAPMRMMGREIMDSFAKTMLKGDQLFIPEIFYAGGSVKRDISSKDLAVYACQQNVDAHFCQTREDVKKMIMETAHSGDRIVIMGARDNTLPMFCKEILEDIK